MERDLPREAGEEKLRASTSPASSHYIIPIVKHSMLVRICTSTDTPDPLIKRFTESQRHAVIEPHTPREGRILQMRRR